MEQNEKHQEIGTKEPYINEAGNVRLVWFSADLRTIRAALNDYKTGLELEREYKTGDELTANDEELGRAMDLIEHINWLEDFDHVQHLVQIDLGSKSYEPAYK